MDIMIQLVIQQLLILNMIFGVLLVQSDKRSGTNFCITELYSLQSVLDYRKVLLNVQGEKNHLPISP